MVADVVPALALVALLVTVYRHPPWWVEALVALAAGAAVLATGTLDGAQVAAERHHLGPVVAFLVAILVVSECCRAAGLFAAIGSRLAATGSARTMYVWAFVVAALTTVALSLDATVVLVTPVVIVAAAALRVPDRPFQVVCVRLANVASLLLPVSNLTNLLAVPDLHLSFGRFAVLMAPVWVVALGSEYAGQRLLFAGDLRSAPAPSPTPAAALPHAPLVVVTAMLAGFAAGSALHPALDPAWVAGVAALVLVVRGLARGELGPRQVVGSAHLPFALFVLSLGLAVAALGEGPSGDVLANLVPSGDGLGALLGLALLGAVLSNIVNNLPATLLLVPLVAPLGAVPVLATLIGINLGSSMTWSGSLANLLWRRTVQRSGSAVDARSFHLLGVLVTPISVVVGVTVLHVWASLV